MRLFFYGTLLDPDVQALVVGRVLGQALVPADLRHFRRVYIAGRLYPMVLPHRGGVVDGAYIESLSKDELARITLYEGDGYRLERHSLYPIAGDGTIAAWLYRASPAARPSTRPWRLDAWQRQDKAAYLCDTKLWLASRGG